MEFTNIARARHALALALYAMRAATPKTAVSGVAASRVYGLRLSYYPFGYCMPYAAASHYSLKLKLKTNFEDDCSVVFLLFGVSCRM
jgi:hypothetical protein